MSLHGLLRRTFRPRGIWREPTLRPKMAAGAPQRPPLTSWRSFPERGALAPLPNFCRRGRRCCATADPSLIYVYAHRQICVCIYITPGNYMPIKFYAEPRGTTSRARRLLGMACYAAMFGTAYPGRGIDDRWSGPLRLGNKLQFFSSALMKHITLVISVSENI